jgi:hypothetical protein
VANSTSSDSTKIKQDFLLKPTTASSHASNWTPLQSDPYKEENEQAFYAKVQELLMLDDKYRKTIPTDEYKVTINAPMLQVCSSSLLTPSFQSLCRYVYSRAVLLSSTHQA